jgi:ParB family chromosome partitioning protein
MTDQHQFFPGSIKKAASTSGFKSSDLWKAPVSSLRIVDGFNVRDEDDAYHETVEYLCNSIIENGYMDDKPLAGYVSEENGEHIVIVTDGHRRYKAVLLAISRGHTIENLPVVTKPRGTSMEDLTIALVTSNSGEKLRPFEVAKVCKRLIGYGMTEADIAKRLMLTRAYVLDLLNLLAAPAEIREMVSGGKISATEATKTIKKHGKDAAEVIATAAKESKDGRVTAKTIKKSVNAIPATVKRAAEYLNRPENSNMKHPTVIALLACVTGISESVIIDSINAQVNT